MKRDDVYGDHCYKTSDPTVVIAVCCTLIPFFGSIWALCFLFRKKCSQDCCECDCFSSCCVFYENTFKKCVCYDEKDGGHNIFRYCFTEKFAMDPRIKPKVENQYDKDMAILAQMQQNQAMPAPVVYNNNPYGQPAPNQLKPDGQLVLNNNVPVYGQPVPQNNQPNGNQNNIIRYSPQGIPIYGNVNNNVVMQQDNPHANPQPQLVNGMPVYT